MFYLISHRSNDTTFICISLDYNFIIVDRIIVKESYALRPPLGKPTSPAPIPKPAPVRAEAPTLGA